MDITSLILEQHAEQRQLFALLDEIDRGDTRSLGAIWAQLRDFLESHAEAEERFFYPQLLKVGKGATDSDSADDETTDAIGDHNKIRDAIAQAEQQDVGSDAWFKAVDSARKENSDHMAEEERQALADFRRHADRETRHRLGLQFATFMAEHRTGVQPHDKDPKRYVESGGDLEAAEA